MASPPDGLKMTESTASATGYLCVIKVHGKYYVKCAVDPYPAPQRTLPGEGFDTPQEAALHYARFKAGLFTVGPKQEQRPRGKGKVRTTPCSLFPPSTDTRVTRVWQKTIASALARLSKQEKRLNNPKRLPPQPQPQPQQQQPQQQQSAAAMAVDLTVSDEEDDVTDEDVTMDDAQYD